VSNVAVKSDVNKNTVVKKVAADNAAACNEIYKKY
jgi:hypothetical protein